MQILNALAHLSSFIFSLVVAFMLSWRLALYAFPFSLMLVIPGVGLGKLMMNIRIKSKGAYEVAGGTAEQAISSIRTVYPNVAEGQTAARFSNALQKTMELGIRQGFMKGLLIVSMGMVFAGWAFQAWVGSILVSERNEKEGTVFVAGVCIIMGGL